MWTLVDNVFHIDDSAVAVPYPVAYEIPIKLIFTIISIGTPSPLIAKESSEISADLTELSHD